MNFKTRKSQEEIVGFAVIILLVVVIALVFFAISMNKPREMRKSMEVTDFLYSSFLYSVACNQQVGDISSLVLACSRNEQCLNKGSCELLRETYREMIEKSIRIGEDSKYKSYTLKIFNSEETFVNLNQGNSTGSSIGSTALIFSSEDSVNVTLRLYY